MYTMIGRILILQMVLSVLLAPRVSSASDILITDLGTLPGGYTSSAEAVNDLGQVVGTSDAARASGMARATLWTVNEPSSQGGDGGGGGGSCFIETLGQNTLNSAPTALLAALGVAVLLLATRVTRTP